MSTPASAQSAASVQQSVRVPAEPARAFQVFTTAMRRWWDLAISANPTKAAIADIVLEPRVGGRWYERGVDGSECDWGRVTVWEPGARLVVDWSPDGHATELDVRFEGPAPRATNVTVVHRGFERFGKDAERMRAMHDACWVELLQRYARLMEEQQLAAAERGVAHDAHAGARAVTDGDTILATIDIGATPERVFRALTTTETEEWWGAPDTYRVTEWKSDLRVGGRWSVVVLLPDGSPFPAGGEYLEIDAPHRIVQTRHYDFDYPDLGRRDTTVTYRLDPIGTGTRVTVRQDGFAGLRVAADHHAEGWVGFLGYLANYLQSATTANG